MPAHKRHAELPSEDNTHTSHFQFVIQTTQTSAITSLPPPFIPIYFYTLSDGPVIASMFVRVVGQALTNLQLARDYLFSAKLSYCHYHFSPAASCHHKSGGKFYLSYSFCSTFASLFRLLVPSSISPPLRINISSNHNDTLPRIISLEKATQQCLFSDSFPGDLPIPSVGFFPQPLSVPNGAYSSLTEVTERVHQHPSSNDVVCTDQNLVECFFTISQRTLSMAPSYSLNFLLLHSSCDPEPTVVGVVSLPSDFPQSMQNVPILSFQTGLEPLDRAQAALSSFLHSSDPLLQVSQATLYCLGLNLISHFGFFGETSSSTSLSILCSPKTSTPSTPNNDQNLFRDVLCIPLCDIWEDHTAPTVEEIAQPISGCISSSAVRCLSETIELWSSKQTEMPVICLLSPTTTLSRLCTFASSSMVGSDRTWISPFDGLSKIAQYMLPEKHCHAPQASLFQVYENHSQKMDVATPELDRSTLSFAQDPHLGDILSHLSTSLLASPDSYPQTEPLLSPSPETASPPLLAIYSAFQDIISSIHSSFSSSPPLSTSFLIFSIISRIPPESSLHWDFSTCTSLDDCYRVVFSGSPSSSTNSLDALPESFQSQAHVIPTSLDCFPLQEQLWNFLSATYQPAISASRSLSLSVDQTRSIAAALVACRTPLARLATILQLITQSCLLSAQGDWVRRNNRVFWLSDFTSVDATLSPGGVPEKLPTGMGITQSHFYMLAFAAQHDIGMMNDIALSAASIPQADVPTTTKSQLSMPQVDLPTPTQNLPPKTIAKSSQPQPLMLHPRFYVTEKLQRIVVQTIQFLSQSSSYQQLVIYKTIAEAAALLHPQNIVKVPSKLTALDIYLYKRNLSPSSSFIDFSNKDVIPKPRHLPVPNEQAQSAAVIPTPAHSDPTSEADDLAFLFPSYHQSSDQRHDYSIAEESAPSSSFSEPQQFNTSTHPTDGQVASFALQTPHESDTSAPLWPDISPTATTNCNALLDQDKSLSFISFFNRQHLIKSEVWNLDAIHRFLTASDHFTSVCFTVFYAYFMSPPAARVDIEVVERFLQLIGVLIIQGETNIQSRVLNLWHQIVADMQDVSISLAHKLQHLDTSPDLLDSSLRASNPCILNPLLKFISLFRPDSVAQLTSAATNCVDFPPPVDPPPTLPDSFSGVPEPSSQLSNKIEALIEEKLSKMPKHTVSDSKLFPVQIPPSCVTFSFQLMIEFLHLQLPGFIKLIKQAQHCICQRDAQLDRVSNFTSTPFLRLSPQFIAIERDLFSILSASGNAIEAEVQRIHDGTCVPSHRHLCSKLWSLDSPLPSYSSTTWSTMNCGYLPHGASDLPRDDTTDNMTLQDHFIHVCTFIVTSSIYSTFKSSKSRNLEQILSIYSDERNTIVKLLQDHFKMLTSLQIGSDSNDEPTADHLPGDEANATTLFLQQVVADSSSFFASDILPITRTRVSHQNTFHSASSPIIPILASAKIRHRLSKQHPNDACDDNNQGSYQNQRATERQILPLYTPMASPFASLLSEETCFDSISLAPRSLVEAATHQFVLTHSSSSFLTMCSLFDDAHCRPMISQLDLTAITPSFFPVVSILKKNASQRQHHQHNQNDNDTQQKSVCLDLNASSVSLLRQFQGGYGIISDQVVLSSHIHMIKDIVESFSRSIDASLQMTSPHLDKPIPSTTPPSFDQIASCLPTVCSNANNSSPPLFFSSTHPFASRSLHPTTLSLFLSGIASTTQPSVAPLLLNLCEFISCSPLPTLPSLEADPMFAPSSPLLLVNDPESKSLSPNVAGMIVVPPVHFASSPFSERFISSQRNKVEMASVVSPATNSSYHLPGYTSGSLRYSCAHDIPTPATESQIPEQLQPLQDLEFLSHRVSAFDLLHTDTTTMQYPNVDIAKIFPLTTQLYQSALGEVISDILAFSHPESLSQQPQPLAFCTIHRSLFILFPHEAATLSTTQHLAHLMLLFGTPASPTHTTISSHSLAWGVSSSILFPLPSSSSECAPAFSSLILPPFLLYRPSLPDSFSPIHDLMATLAYHRSLLAASLPWALATSFSLIKFIRVLSRWYLPFSVFIELSPLFFQPMAVPLSAHLPIETLPLVSSAVGSFPQQAASPHGSLFAHVARTCAAFISNFCPWVSPHAISDLTCLQLLDSNPLNPAASSLHHQISPSSTTFRTLSSLISARVALTDPKSLAQNIPIASLVPASLHSRKFLFSESLANQYRIFAPASQSANQFVPPSLSWDLLANSASDDIPLAGTMMSLPSIWGSNQEEQEQPRPVSLKAVVFQSMIQQLLSSSRSSWNSPLIGAKGTQLQPYEVISVITSTGRLPAALFEPGTAVTWSESCSSAVFPNSALPVDTHPNSPSTTNQGADLLHSPTRIQLSSIEFSPLTTQSPVASLSSNASFFFNTPRPSPPPDYFFGSIQPLCTPSCRDFPLSYSSSSFSALVALSPAAHILHHALSCQSDIASPQSFYHSLSCSSDTALSRALPSLALATNLNLLSIWANHVHWRADTSLATTTPQPNLTTSHNDRMVHTTLAWAHALGSPTSAPLSIMARVAAGQTYPSSKLHMMYLPDPFTALNNATTLTNFVSSSHPAAPLPLASVHIPHPVGCWPSHSSLTPPVCWASFIAPQSGQLFSVPLAQMLRKFLLFNSPPSLSSQHEITAASAKHMSRSDVSSISLSRLADDFQRVVTDLYAPSLGLARSGGINFPQLEISSFSSQFSPSSAATTHTHYCLLPLFSSQLLAVQANNWFSSQAIATLRQSFSSLELETTLDSLQDQTDQAIANEIDETNDKSNDHSTSFAPCKRLQLEQCVDAMFVEDLDLILQTPSHQFPLETLGVKQDSSRLVPSPLLLGQEVSSNNKTTASPESSSPLSPLFRQLAITALSQPSLMSNSHPPFAVLLVPIPSWVHAIINGPLESFISLLHHSLLRQFVASSQALSLYILPRSIIAKLAQHTSVDLSTLSSPVTPSVGTADSDSSSPIVISNILPMSLISSLSLDASARNILQKSFIPATLTTISTRLAVEELVSHIERLSSTDSFHHYFLPPRASPPQNDSTLVNAHPLTQFQELVLSLCRGDIRLLIAHVPHISQIGKAFSFSLTRDQIAHQYTILDSILPSSSATIQQHIDSSVFIIHPTS